MATEQQTLRAEIKELRLAVTGLAHLLDEKVQTKVETEVAAKGVPREEYARRVKASGRRVIVGMVALVLLVVLVVGWNRVTLQQAQELAAGDFRRLITTCRTTGPPLNPADLAYCNQRVPGFTQARQRAIDTAATAKANQERLDRLEREVADLRQ
jgi:polyhydroxyalkanoate synthesis regulator phasin